MSEKVRIHPRDLPTVTTVGKYEVMAPWVHGTRHLTINTMIYVIKGRVYVNEDGQDYEVAEGHSFFFKSGSVQRGTKEIQPGAKWYWVSFDANIGQGEIDRAFYDLPKMMDCRKTDQVNRILMRMEEAYVSDMPYKQQLLDGCLYQIFYELLNLTVRQADGSTSAKITPKVIKRLNKQLEGQFSAGKIAEDLGMNYSYISRKFKEETGFSVNQYYMKLKINQAINLLHTSDMNMTEISNQLHYPNPYYFSRVFKKVTGMSPSEYKKHMY